MTEQLVGQVNLFDPDSWSGRTSPEPYQAPEETTKERTSRRSLKRSSRSQSREPLCMCVYRTEDGQTPGAITLKMAPGALLGAYTMPSTGERPNTLMAECSLPALPSGVAVSRLSQILEVSVDPKYSLSAKACRGILARAEKRGKVLPPALKAALDRQSLSKNEPESPEEEKES